MPPTSRAFWREGAGLAMQELLVEERDGVRIERRDLRPGVNIFTTKMKRFLIFFL